MAEERTNELGEATVQEPQKIDAAVTEPGAVQDGAGEPEIGANDAPSAEESENWRLRRDAAELARQRLQAANAAQSAESMAESEGPEQTAAKNTSLAEFDRKLSRKERRQKEKEEAAARKEEAERRKREAQEEKERLRREAQEEKERQKRLAEEDRQRKLHEKKEAKAIVRQERRAEWKSLWHMAEFAMFVTFIVLAIDQTGIYGFLFVWLFIAVMAASVALLLLGVVRAIRKKRCGIIFFVAIVGIIACTAWFIFLVSSQGLGLGPVPG